MTEITELRQLRGERYAVCLSDGEELRVTLNLIADHGLYRGLELTDEALAALRAAAARAGTRDRALRMISARPLSERELYDRLLEKGASEPDAAAAVAWLLDLHFLDDAQYAGMVVRHCAGKGYGARRVREELRRRKIPKELWDEALSALPEQDGTLQKLLRSRMRGADWDDRAALKRATDALLRRGFGWEEIRAAVEHCRCAAEDEEKEEYAE